MNVFRSRLMPVLVALLALASAGHAQQRSRSFSVGYVYPAGAQQGTTSEHVIAGQFLAGLTNVYVTGGGVTATISDFIHPIQGGELNRLRILADELLAKKAVVRKDFKALEAFRSFKNAKSIKKDSAEEDKEIEELKKKYANATWTAEDEKLLAETRKRMAGGVRRPANPAICELVVCNLTVAPDAVPGEREIRLVTAAGISNPLVFHVGQLPEFSEPASKNIAQQVSAVARISYARNTKPKPVTTVTLPAVVNGQILPGEVDRFRFAATKGQKLVIAVQARQLIPYISDAVPGWFQATLSLYDSEGKELAYDDDFRFNPDPVLYYEIPADGDYVIEVKDSIYRGREDFVYRITIGETPFITSIFPLGGPAGEKTPVELKGWNLPAATLTMDDANKTPGIYPLSIRKGSRVSNFVPFAVDDLPECLAEKSRGGKPQAQHVTLPTIINGRIGKPDETHVFRFDGKASQEIVAEVMARRLNSPLDSVLKLTDAVGKEVAFNDDNTDRGAGLTTHHADSYLTATLPKDGSYLLYLRDTQHKGGFEYGYRLRISAPLPDFALRVVPSSLNARTGNPVSATVFALRKDGFSEPISIQLKDAPAGFKLGNTVVPTNTNQVKIALTAPLAPQDEPVTLKLEGRATVNGREIVHPAVPTQDMMQAFEYRHLVPSQELKVSVTGIFLPKGAGASVKILSDLPIRIPAGGTVKVRLAAPAKAASKVRLELAEAPEGIVIKSVSPSSDGLEVELAGDAAKLKPGQKGSLVVAAYSAPPPPPPPSKKNKMKPKPQPVYKGKPLGILPLISFEVVAR
ncbi:MAG: PPC domain-containing protein [Verrucomicrobia bacterium]|nr:PPC domain-containing protein [Verrucomicrobiota bacterium]